jgi:Phosphoketolase
MNYPQNKLQRTAERIRACNYLTVTQIFLKDNFLLERPLSFDDIKPRLLGHWGTCPGINLVYSCMRNIFADQKENTVFILGPGHGFPALQANLFYDGDLAAVDPTLSRDYVGLAKISELFSRIGGFPSHASPSAPGVICEGGELGYSLATAYGYCLGHPERTAIVLLGDGEFETATTLASLNLNDLLSSPNNGKIIPILHLNGYKISGPTVASRRSAHQLNELIRGFGFQPIRIEERLSPVDTEELDIVDSFDDDEEDSDSSSFEAVEHKIADLIREEYDDQDQDTARTAFELTYQDTDLIIQNLIIDLDAALLQARQSQKPVFIILETEKGLTGPLIAEDLKVRGNFKAHQVPLPKAKSDETELRALESWLRSYHFEELFNREKGFIHE